MCKVNLLRVEFLEEKANQYQNPCFIESDPIQIPHRFSKKEDIEISGFLTSTIAWGNRKSIIKSANRMIDYLENAPFDFVMNHSDKDIKCIESFVHRDISRDRFYFLYPITQKHLHSPWRITVHFFVQERRSMRIWYFGASL